MSKPDTKLEDKIEHGSDTDVTTRTQEQKIATIVHNVNTGYYLDNGGGGVASFAIIQLVVDELTTLRREFGDIIPYKACLHISERIVELNKPLKKKE